ncbi:hypothetical protein [Hymenobacter sp. 5414T-23]
MAPENIPHLFDRFRRFQKGASAPKGTA